MAYNFSKSKFSPAYTKKFEIKQGTTYLILININVTLYSKDVLYIIYYLIKINKQTNSFT